MTESFVNGFIKFIAVMKSMGYSNLEVNNFYCCTVHFDNTYVHITNKCTSLLHI